MKRLTVQLTMAILLTMSGIVFVLLRVFLPLHAFKYSILRELSFIGMSGSLCSALTNVTLFERAAQATGSFVTKCAVSVAKSQIEIVHFLR